MFNSLYSRAGTYLGVACLAAASLQAETFFVDFENGNPMSGGKLTTEQAYSGNQSIYLGASDQATLKVPQDMLGKALIVEMMVFDMAKWIDRSVTNYPTSSYGPRWGVSTGAHTNAQTMGVSILERTFVSSAQGYGINGINGEGNDTRFAPQWFSPTFMSGGREADLLPGTGGSYVDGVWEAGPGGIGRWSKWTFFVDAEGRGTITLNDTRTVRPHDIGSAITEVWIYGGRSQQNLALGGVYVDDISIRVAADANLVRVSTPPTIDGIKEDGWLASPRKPIATVTNGVAPTDHADLSANWYGLYDEDNFYLAIDIRDESLNDDAASEEWMNDRIEVYFNMDDGRPAGNARTGDNYQYVFALNNDTASVSGSGSLTGVVFKQSSSAQGWFVEIAFPWDTLFLNTTGADVKQGYQFGFDVGVVDNDGGANYDSIAFWHSQTGGLWGNMDSAGTVEMAGLFDGNYAPVIAHFDEIQEAEVGKTSVYTITATDLNGSDTLTYSGSNLPSFVTVTKTDNNTATVTVAPKSGDANVYSFNVSVSDGTYTDTTTVQMVVRKAGVTENQAPEFASVAPVSVDQGGSIEIPLSVTDLDSFTVTLSLADGALEWASVIDNGDKTGVLTLSPPLNTVAGDYAVTVLATDAEGLVNEIEVEIEVIQVTASEDWWTLYGDPDEGWVDTGSFLGHIWFAEAPWFFHSGTNSWLYVDHTVVIPGQGAWIFSPALVRGSSSIPNNWEGYQRSGGWVWTAFEWLYVGNDPYVYSHTLNTWFYVDSLGEGGSWIYFYDLNDVTPPSSPIRVEATPVSDTRIDITWRAATDNLWVEGYDVYRGSEYLGSVEKGMTYTDTGLNPQTSYTYTVYAYDAAGNRSPASSPATGATHESRAEVDASWQAAWDSWDEATIEAWYHNNTGPIALGIEEDDMWNPTPNGLTINQSWLDQNSGNGHVYQENGRWIVEGVKAGWFSVSVSPVTLRGCLALLPNSTPGMAITRTGGGTLIVEYCEVRAAPGVVPNVRAIEGSNMIVRNCRVGPGMDGASGYRPSTDCHLEYNWVFGLTGHHSGIAIRGNNTVARRNYSEIGTSASLFIYAHDTGAPDDGLNNILVEENYINSPISYYGMNPGGERNEKAQSATNVRVLLNRWGEKNFWPDDTHDIGGSHRTWLGDIPAGDWVDARGNIWGGNHWIATGNYISPKTSQFAWDHPDHTYNDPWIAAHPQE